MDRTDINDPTYADQETYFLPAQDQRVFGAGIKRKRVPFVPASKAEDPDAATTTTPKTAVGDRYLSIVLQNQVEEVKNSSDNSDTRANCEVCGQPSAKDYRHESSISHQFCLEHSHPPSHLPREHIGLKILGSQGWDPDSRLGLGATGDGIRVPIKSRIKNDTVGLGMKKTTRDNNERMIEASQNKGTKRLNAKEVRAEEIKATERAQRLRQTFYGDDLSKYLEPNR